MKNRSNSLRGVISAFDFFLFPFFFCANPKPFVPMNTKYFILQSIFLLEMPFFDLHIHTRHSKCCPEKYEYKDIINRHSDEFDGFGVSDHCHHPYYKPRFVQKYKEQQKDYSLEEKGFVGLEITLCDPKARLGVDTSYLKFVDYYLIAEHVQVAGPFSPFFLLKQKTRQLLRKLPEKQDKLNKIIETVFRMQFKGIKENPHTILAHPLRFPRNINYIDERMLEMLYKLIDAASVNEVAIELHRGFFHSYSAESSKEESIGGISAFEFAEEFFKKVAKSDVKLSLGSDAHSLKRVGKLVRWREILRKFNVSERRFVQIEDLNHKFKEC